MHIARARSVCKAMGPTDTSRSSYSIDNLLLSEVLERKLMILAPAQNVDQPPLQNVSSRFGGQFDFCVGCVKVRQ